MIDGDRPSRKGGGGEMPHHPAHGAEVQHSRGFVHAAVKVMLLLVLEERTGNSVYDSLGQTGRAARVQNVKGVGGR